MDRTAGETLRFAQKDVQRWETVLPYSSLKYAWDAPTAAREISLEIQGDEAPARDYPVDQARIASSPEL